MKNLILLISLITLFSCSTEEPCEPSPSFTMEDVADITDVSATVSGSIIRPTCELTVTSQGIVYSTSTLPKTDDNIIELTGSDVSASLTKLNQNKTYYARLFFENPSGVFYGDQVTFKTSVGSSALTTTDISEIKTSTATSGGNITENGGALITAKGVCWSKSPTPTIDDSKTEDGTGLGSYISFLTGLISNTTYYVRAYSTNEAATTYGNEVSFATDPNITFISNTFTLQSCRTAQLEAEYNPKGLTSEVIKETGFEVSSSSENEVYNSTTSDNPFSVNIDNLEYDIEYTFKPYVITSLDNVYYGDVNTFIIEENKPVVNIDVPISSIYISNYNIHSEIFYEITIPTNFNYETILINVIDTSNNTSSYYEIADNNLNGSIKLQNLNSQTNYLIETTINSTNCDNYSFNSDFNTNSIYIQGDIGPGGGIVFMIDGNGSGREFYDNISEKVSWGCYSTSTGATDGSIDAGLNNTDLIVQNCSETNNAAYLSKSFSNNGFNDWYLPSLNELRLINNSFNLRGDKYWSSTEDNAFAATGIDTDWRSDAIPYDYFNGVHKSSSFFIYCPVRRF